MNSTNKSKCEKKFFIILASKCPPWPPLDTDVVVSEVDRPEHGGEREGARLRLHTGEWVTLLFVLLLASFSAHAMWTDDKEMLNKAFELVKYGLVASVGWTFGKRSSEP